MLPVPLRVFPVILLLMLLPASADALHPISHVDAWMRISDRVDLRLIVFLDDVIRFQEPAVDAAGRVTTDEMHAAIERHGQTLLQQIRIFDGTGEPFRAVLLEAPELDVRSGSLDPEADAGLRLAWKYRLELPDSDSSWSWTFLTRLGHPELKAPPELRLHVLHQHTGQRIDSVAADGRPHTILFRRPAHAGALGEERPSGLAAAMPNDEPVDLNSASSIWILSRRTLVHEFTAPLSLMQHTSRWTEFSLQQWLNTDDRTRELPVIDDMEREQLRAGIREWFRDNLRLYDSRRRLMRADTEIEVRFLSAEEVGAGAAGGEAQAEEPNPLNPLTTVVGVRCRYSNVFSTAGLRLQWQESPGEFDHINLTGVTPFSSQSQSFSLADLVNYAEVAAAGRGVPIEFPEFVDGEQSSGKSLLTEAVPWVETEKWPTLRGLLLAVLILLLTAAAVMVRSRRPADGQSPTHGGQHSGSRLWVWPRSRLVAACLLAGGILLADRQIIRTGVDDRAKPIVEQLLREVYAASLLTDASAGLDRMARVLSPELSENLFVSIEETLSEGEQVPAAVRLRDVRLEDCCCMEVDQSDEEFVITCQWRVLGDIYHWGHVHPRILLLKGQLQIRGESEGAEIENTAAETGRIRWKIAGLQLESLIPESVDTQR